MKIDYPDKFIAKCKAAYPNWSSLHMKLAEGDDDAGRLLRDALEVISPDEIVEADDLERLKSKAKRIINRRSLYIEWSVIKQRIHIDTKIDGGRSANEHSNA